jgi:hypothetical protein
MRLQLIMILFFIALFTASGSNAQGKIKEDKLEFIRMVAQYPYCFEDLREDLDSSTQGEFKCKLEFLKTESCTLLTYGSDSTGCSLNVLVLSTKDFKKAATAYKKLYDRFHFKVNYFDIWFQMKGEFTAPKADNNINEVILKMVPDDAIMEHMRIRISLNYVNENWQLGFLIADVSRIDR